MPANRKRPESAEPEPGRAAIPRCKCSTCRIHDNIDAEFADVASGWLQQISAFNRNSYFVVDASKLS